jgi:hypothetical protein
MPAARRSLAKLLAPVAAFLAVLGSAVAADPPVAMAPMPVQSAPAPAGGDIRIYILDGVNPLGLAGIDRLADQLRGAGFRHTRVGGWYSAAAFEREIRATHAGDPSARFAVIGYSAGSYPARTLANRLVRGGVPVAVLGYVGGDYLRDTPETRVPGVGRVVNVTGNGYLLTGRNLMFNGTDVSGATNVRLAGTNHYSLPTNPRTFQTLYEALSAADGR